MTFEDFDKWQAELWAECVKMRDTKGREYSHEKDRFANFNRLANELGISNVTVGWVYLKKHLDSIASYVKDGKTHSVEPIRGRIIDAIVYLTLIGGMIEEEIGREKLENVPDYDFIGVGKLVISKVTGRIGTVKGWSLGKEEVIVQSDDKEWTEHKDDIRPVSLQEQLRRY